MHAAAGERAGVILRGFGRFREEGGPEVFVVIAEPVAPARGDAAEAAGGFEGSPGRRSEGFGVWGEGLHKGPVFSVQYSVSSLYSCDPY